jgi:hypothetical protein
MKIPESVRIGGIEYKVEREENLRQDTELLYGQISYTDCVIRLSSTDRKNPQVQCITLWHEILHGIREHSTMKIENEEEVVEMFAKGIVQVLNDNERRLFDFEEVLL